MCRWRCRARAIENRADEYSSENTLLLKVKFVWDIWRIRVIGPQSFYMHNPDAYRGDFGGGGIEGAERRGPR